jgi:hypothetical protein
MIASLFVPKASDTTLTISMTEECSIHRLRSTIPCVSRFPFSVKFQGLTPFTDHSEKIVKKGQKQKDEEVRQIQLPNLL